MPPSPPSHSRLPTLTPRASAPGLIDGFDFWSFRNNSSFIYLEQIIASNKIVFGTPLVLVSSSERGHSRITCPVLFTVPCGVTFVQAEHGPRCYKTFCILYTCTCTGTLALAVEDVRVGYRWYPCSCASIDWTRALIMSAEGGGWGGVATSNRCPPLTVCLCIFLYLSCVRDSLCTVITCAARCPQCGHQTITTMAVALMSHAAVTVASLLASAIVSYQQRLAKADGEGLGE